MCVWLMGGVLSLAASVYSSQNQKEEEEWGKRKNKKNEEKEEGTINQILRQLWLVYGSLLSQRECAKKPVLLLLLSLLSENWRLLIPPYYTYTPFLLALSCIVVCWRGSRLAVGSGVEGGSSCVVCGGPGGGKILQLHTHLPPRRQERPSQVG